MNALREWRLSRPEGFRTLEAAGALLGITASAMLRYENGTRRIHPTKVMSISAITGIAPEILRPDFYTPARDLKRKATAHAG